MASTVWNIDTTAPATYTENPYDNNSNLVRLIEDPEIKKDIRFDELSLSENGGTPTNGGSQLNTVGNDYPIIRINDMVLGKDDIQSMLISSKGFLPTIELSLKFANTALISKNMPKDGDMISVFVRTNTSAINYLRNDFIVNHVDSNISSKSANNTVFLRGELFIEGFTSNNNTFGIIGTSKDVMKEIAKKFKMGFAYNDADDMDDLQNWLCCFSSPQVFIEDVTRHSWKNNMSFFKSWVDLYYNLCFVNVNKFLSSDENPEDEIDLTFFSSTVALNDLTSSNDKPDNAKPFLKVFSNFDSFKGSSFYISKWHPVNRSNSLSSGYSNIIHSFTHNQNVYIENKDNCEDTLIVNPVYDTSKLDSYIILRGRAKYDENANPDNEQARVNYSMQNTYINHIWSGVEYKMDKDENSSSNNTWSGNVHHNYHNAAYQNEINDIELNKLYIEVVCDGLCLQVMRGERVPVFLKYNTPLDKNISPDDPGFNRFYSGYYIVDSIEYKYNGKVKTGYSSFSTIMSLKRREWPTPEAIKSDSNDNPDSSDKYDN